MKILLYNPDNGVTRDFMPHLWMFLLQSLTPTEHEVLLIDGNAQPHTPLKMSIKEAHDEVRYGWENSYTLERSLTPSTR